MGFSFDKFLFVLAEQTKNKAFKEIILNTEEKILKGDSFSAVISEYSDHKLIYPFISLSL